MDPKQDQNDSSQAPSEFYQAQHGLVQPTNKPDPLTFKVDSYAHKLPPYARPKVIGIYFLGVIVLWFITRLSPLFIILFSVPVMLVLFFGITDEGRQLLRKVLRDKDDNMINKPKS